MLESLRPMNLTTDAQSTLGATERCGECCDRSSTLCNVQLDKVSLESVAVVQVVGVHILDSQCRIGLLRGELVREQDVGGESLQG